MTTYFDNFLKTNQAYADLHGTAHLPIKPKTKVAIVTCMDSRLHVAQALGLALEMLIFYVMLVDELQTMFYVL